MNGFSRKQHSFMSSFNIIGDCRKIILLWTEDWTRLNGTAMRFCQNLGDSQSETIVKIQQVFVEEGQIVTQRVLSGNSL